jgi:hypothetical protein
MGQIESAVERGTLVGASAVEFGAAQRIAVRDPALHACVGGVDERRNARADVQET